MADTERLKKLQEQALAKRDSSRAEAVQRTISRVEDRAAKVPTQPESYGTTQTRLDADRTTLASRDLTAEQATLSKLGYAPKTPEEIALFAKTTYPSDTLAGFSDADKKALGLGDIATASKVFDPTELKKLGYTDEQIAQLQPLGEVANKTFADKLALGDPNSALGVLQKALNIKSNIF